MQVRVSKKDSGHNQAVVSIEATTHSYDSEIRKLIFRRHLTRRMVS